MFRKQNSGSRRGLLTSNIPSRKQRRRQSCKRAAGRNQLLVFTENLLENTDGCSDPSMFSRGGCLLPAACCLLPSISADVRAILMTSSHSEGRSLKGRNIFVSISNPPARPSLPAPAATSSVNTSFRPRAMVRPRQAAQRPQNRRLKMGSVHMEAAAGNNKPISMEVDDAAAAAAAGAGDKAAAAVKAKPQSNSFFSDLFKK